MISPENGLQAPTKTPRLSLREILINLKEKLTPPPTKPEWRSQRTVPGSRDPDLDNELTQRFQDFN